MKRFLLTSVMFGLTAFLLSAAVPAPLPSGNVLVTVFIPEDVNAGRIYAVECDAEGNEISRTMCAGRLRFLDWPKVQMCREITFAASGDAGYFRLEAAESAAGYIPGKCPGNLLPSGAFEGKGWWFGSMNTVLQYVEEGRGGGKALKMDTRKENNGKPVLCGAGSSEMNKLKDERNLPALMRVFVRTEAGAGNGDGFTIRMRTFDAASKFTGDCASVWTVQGKDGGEWIEHRRILDKPFKKDAVFIEVYMVNLAPRDGVSLLFDDMEILPAHHVAPLYELKTPEEDVYADGDYTVSFNKGKSGDGISGVLEAEVPFTDVDGKETMLSALIAADEESIPATEGGTFTVTFTDKSTGKAVVSKKAAADKNGAASVTLQAPAGDYRVKAVMSGKDNKEFSREWDCRILEDPFAM